jgi:alanine racemase
VTASALPVVRIDLDRVRRNVADVRERTGVDVLAVVKADAYGLGLLPVARAVAELVAGFYVFRASEAVVCDLGQVTGKPVISALSDHLSVEALRGQRIRPGVWDVTEAERLRRADPLLIVDVGQQRFACAEERIDSVLSAGGCREAFTHASTAHEVEQFDQLTSHRNLRRHAAGTSLLSDPRAWFDAVRPGLAMYRGAVRVSTRLVEARDSRGPAGYSGFQTSRHGVFLGGYSTGLTTGACLVNGVRRRVLEMGMQSGFVELGPTDRAGDEIVLLGDGLSEQDVALAWRCSPQEALYRLARCGEKRYVG